MAWFCFLIGRICEFVCLFLVLFLVLCLCLCLCLCLFCFVLFCFVLFVYQLLGVWLFDWTTDDNWLFVVVGCW